MKKLLFSILVFIVTGAAETALCGQLRVVSTIPDFGSIAEEIGGPLVKVDALVKPTQDPHFVDAKPSLMVTLNRADILLVTGMELEAGWLPPLLTGSRNSDIQRGAEGYLDCSTLIAPMDVRAPDRAKGDIHPGGNPHYWTDPRNGMLIAKGVHDKLIQIDPSHKDEYRAGLDSFLDKLNRRISAWEAELAATRGTKVVVYHESWVYFLDWAGLNKIGALEPKPGIPPKPGHVAELIEKVKGQNVKYILQESFYPTRLSKIFADKSGAELRVLPTMVGADGTKSYFDVIDRLVKGVTR